jgi:hypothetical protein
MPVTTYIKWLTREDEAMRKAREYERDILADFFNPK